MRCDQRRRILLGALLSTPTLAVPLSAFGLPRSAITVNMAMAYLSHVAFKAPHGRCGDEPSSPLV